MSDNIKSRNELISLLKPYSIGLELGVANGSFSRILYESNIFSEYWGIDKWNDHHNIKEYFHCIRSMPNANIIRAQFNQCIEYFSDEYFDFIYIDGYAHIGQSKGQTLYDWYPKLKSGGIFAGHDYDEVNWINTYIEVNKFIEKNNLKLNIINGNDMYNSWWVYKL